MSIDRLNIERAARQAQAREIARLATLGAARIAALFRLLVSVVKDARLQRAHAHLTVVGR